MGANQSTELSNVSHATRMAQLYSEIVPRKITNFKGDEAPKARQFLLDHIEGAEFLIELAELNESITHDHAIFKSISERVVLKHMEDPSMGSMMYDALCVILFSALLPPDGIRSKVQSCNWLPFLEFHVEMMGGLDGAIQTTLPVHGYMTYALLVEWMVEHWYSTIANTMKDPHLGFLAHMELTRLLREKRSWSGTPLSIHLPQLECCTDDAWFESWRQQAEDRYRYQIVKEDLRFVRLNHDTSLDTEFLYHEDLDTVPDGSALLIINPNGVPPMKNEHRHRRATPHETVHKWVFESLLKVIVLDAYVHPQLRGIGQLSTGLMSAWMIRSLLTTTIRFLNTATTAERIPSSCQSLAHRYIECFELTASVNMPAVTNFLESLPFWLLDRDLRREPGPGPQLESPMDDLVLHAEQCQLPARTETLLTYDGISCDSLVELYAVLRGLMILSSRVVPAELTDLPYPSSNWIMLQRIIGIVGAATIAPMPSIQQHLSDVPDSVIEDCAGLETELTTVLGLNATLGRYIYYILASYQPASRGLQQEDYNMLSKTPGSGDPMWRHAIFAASEIHHGVQVDTSMRALTTSVPDTSVTPPSFQAVNIFNAALVFIACEPVFLKYRMFATSAEHQPCYTDSDALMHSMYRGYVTSMDDQILDVNTIENEAASLVSDSNRLNRWWFHVSNCPIWRHEWMTFCQCRPLFTASLVKTLLETLNRLCNDIRSSECDSEVADNDLWTTQQVDTNHCITQATICTLILTSLISHGGVSDALDKQLCGGLPSACQKLFRHTPDQLSCLGLVCIVLMDWMQFITRGALRDCQTGVTDKAIQPRMLRLVKSLELCLSIASRRGTIDDVKTAEHFVMNMERAVKLYELAYDNVYGTDPDASYTHCLLFAYSNLVGHFNFIREVQMNDALSKGQIIFSMLRSQRRAIHKLEQFTVRVHTYNRPLSHDLHLKSILSSLIPLYEELEEKLRLSTDVDEACDVEELGIEHVKATIKDTVGSIQYRLTRTIKRSRSCPQKSESPVSATSSFFPEPVTDVVDFVNCPTEEDALARLIYQNMVDSVNRELLHNVTSSKRA